MALTVARSGGRPYSFPGVIRAGVKRANKVVWISRMFIKPNQSCEYSRIMLSIVVFTRILQFIKKLRVPPTTSIDP